MRVRRTVAWAATLVALAVTGCRFESADDRDSTTKRMLAWSAAHPIGGLTLPAGTSLVVTLATPLDTRTARAGARWSGSLQRASVHGSRNVLPAGGKVAGTVAAVSVDDGGAGAALDIRLDSLRIGERGYVVDARLDSIRPDSRRPWLRPGGRLPVLADGAALSFTIREGIAIRP